MQVSAELSSGSDPHKVIDSLDDVICRCGSHPRIKKGIKTAAKMMRKEG
jgi:aerobic-type carbon monoxide dehydrogenase small subunit (CoxS/CutS family)